MANWAVVIGIDRYWSEGAHLRGAVRDALAMRKWLLDPAGGNVPPDNLQLVLAPGPNSEPVPEELQSLPIGTKANIIVAINNLIQLSGGTGERLYFFYAGHGLTARVSNRDESALLATDFTSVNTDHSLALRSLWEYFETTQFADQFFFVDACRNVPPWEEGAEFELGRWTLPRSRDPGVPPVQQFILYATSPKLKATEVRLIPGAEHGVFTAALLDGLRGVGTAKAWSWERNVYEVRWERLADYVKERVVRERRPVAETPEGKVLIQVPQDAGSRGVADRERDVAVTSFPPNAFPKERLEVFLEPNTAYPEAEVRVLDALGDVVASQVGGTGDSVVFELAPRTYALRAESRTYGAGRVPAPIDLYEALADKQRPKIVLRLPDQPAEAEAGSVEAAVPAEPTAAAAVEIATEAAATRGVETVADGTIPLTAPDPLSIVEVKDETGRVVKVGRVGPELTLPPGFYRLGHVGPERALATPVVALQPGEVEKRVRLKASKPEPVTLQLLERMGGTTGVANTIKVPDCAPAAWALSSTLVAMAVGKALNGEKGEAALDLTTVAPARGGAGRGGIALYVVSDGDELDLALFDVRVWEARHPVSRTTKQLRLVGPRLAELVLASKPGPIWLSIKRRNEGRPMVFALTVLRDRQTTVVVQITAGIRLFQYQPALAGGPAAVPDTMRRVEYLERMLLSGRLDGAQELALELAAVDDPFIGCLCGYVLLRLGRWKELHDVVERVVESAPQLADGFVLRGEHAAATKDPGAKQAFAEAVGTGIPVFAEGLTRLLEGLRANDVQHPRSAIVRYVFANHMRGSMWSVFTPSRFQPGKLVVTGADTGLEA